MIAAMIARRGEIGNPSLDRLEGKPDGQGPAEVGSRAEGRADLEDPVAVGSQSIPGDRRKSDGLGPERPREKPPNEQPICGVEHAPVGITDHHISHQVLIPDDDLRNALVDVIRIAGMSELFLNQSFGDENRHGIGDAPTPLVDGLVL